MLGRITGEVASFIGDGGYDQDRVYASVAERYPETAVVVPPRATAVPSETAATAPTQRDRHLQHIAEHGRKAWQKASGYTARARAEAAIGRFKQVIGDAQRSRADYRRSTEVDVAVHALTRISELDPRTRSAPPDLGAAGTNAPALQGCLTRCTYALVEGCPVPGPIAAVQHFAAFTLSHDLPSSQRVELGWMRLVRYRDAASEEVCHLLKSQRGWVLPLVVLLCNTVAAPVLAAPLRGEASWYGKFHHGRPMANGRPFRMMQATVAHRTLPLGTVVEVRNLENGRTITAEVTDRGPYVRGRVLDVSKGVAQSLNMLDAGTARVEIRLVSSQE